MILLDFNQVCISNLMAQLGNHTDADIDEDILRHMVLNTIRSLRVKFKDYGDMVICCDDKHVWRKQVFPYYKANRKKSREQSEIDWVKIFGCLNNIRDELKAYFPYRVLQIEGAEADDVIGTLAIKYGQMLNTGKKILILSGDKDFVQLHVFGNVQQYDPVRKKFIKQDDPIKFTRELILKGDRGDGIPNILSKDDVLVTGERQRPVRTDKYINIDKPREFFTGELLRNWIRNEQLIDLTFIPENIQAKVIEQYDLEADKPRDKLFNYFVKYKLKLLMEHIGEF